MIVLNMKLLFVYDNINKKGNSNGSNIFINKGEILKKKFY